nr:alpha/beta hydrolase [Ornithinimicrobium cryptoxanthini]
MEVRASGTGEPVLLIQTALAPEEVAHLAREPVLADRHRILDLRRRGYGASSPASGPGSVTRDAADCLAVLRATQCPPAHVVGASYGAAVALELFALAPEMVATLVLLEPPPVHGSSGPEFLAACSELSTVFVERGVTVALDEFTRTLRSRTRWAKERPMCDPEVVAAVERDATTFFMVDIPALMSWRLDPTQLTAREPPVLYLGGGSSHPWFEDQAAWVASLFPHCEQHVGLRSRPRGPRDPQRPSRAGAREVLCAARRTQLLRRSASSSSARTRGSSVLICTSHESTS